MSPSSPDVLHVMPCGVGALWIGFAAEHVLEVLGATPWARLPRARPELPGVLGWHGRALPVLDLGRVLPPLAPLAEGQARARTLVCSASGATLAVPIDRAREVIAVSIEHRRAPSGDRARIAAWELDVEGAMAPVLDLPRLVARFVEEAVGR